MLQEWFQEMNSQFWDEKPKRRDSEDLGNSSHKRLGYQLWNVDKYGSCADAAITGIMPPPLMEIQVLGGLQGYAFLSNLLVIYSLFLVFEFSCFYCGQSSQRYYCAVTIGDDAVISAYRFVLWVLHYYIML